MENIESDEEYTQWVNIRRDYKNKIKDDDSVAKVSKINKYTDENIESDEEYTQWVEVQKKI